MRTIARFMDARNTAEGKFLSVLLSVLLVFSFLNVTMFTDFANAEDDAEQALVETPEDVDVPEAADEELVTEEVTEPEAEEPQEEAAPEQEPVAQEPEEEVTETPANTTDVALKIENATVVYEGAEYDNDAVLTIPTDEDFSFAVQSEEGSTVTVEADGKHVAPADGVYKIESASLADLDVVKVVAATEAVEFEEASEEDEPQAIGLGEDSEQANAPEDLDADENDTAETEQPSGIHKNPAITYKFVVNGKDFGTPQLLTNGEAIALPIVPVETGKVFVGWSFAPREYVSESVTSEVKAVVPEGTDFENKIVVTATAEFENAYTVTFQDESNRVIATKIVAEGESLTADDVDSANAKYQAPAGLKLVGWALNNQEVDLTSQKITSDITVKPITKESAWVSFVSQGGTSKPAAQVKEDGTIDFPSDPVRSGYTFDGWFTEAEGGSKVETNATFASQTTLYAHWTAQRVSYTIIYWQENANWENPYLDEADRDQVQYSYLKTETRQGYAGSTTSVTADRPESGFKNARVENTEIKGDGSTIVNVYYDREEYSVYFYTKQKGCGKEEHKHSFDRREYKSSLFGGYYIYYGGCYPDAGSINATCGKEAHTHDRWCPNQESYQVDEAKTIAAKYGATISSKWPEGCWYVDDNENVSQSNLMQMPLGGTEFYGPRSKSNSVADYYVEALPGQGGASVGGRTYILHHQDKGPNANVTDEERYEIAGFTCNTTLSNKNNTNYSGAKFYYNRNTYEVHYFSDGIELQSKSVFYEQEIDGESYIPNKEGYVFGGWFIDQPCTTSASDTLNGTMPSRDITVYAKWIAPQKKVTVHASSDSEAAEPWTVDAGSLLDESVLNTNAGIVDKIADDPDTFLGWFYKEGNTWQAWNFNNPVDDDIELYARWRDEAFTITYQIAEADQQLGVVAPTDTNKYVDGSEAVVKGIPADGTLNNQFSHWVDESGNEVKANDAITMNGNVTLTAVFQPALPIKLVKITYNPNGGAGSEYQTLEFAYNGLATADKNTFVAPNGYEFDSWNTRADGTGLEVKEGDKVRVNDWGATTLYAQWKPGSYPAKVQFYFDGELDDSLTEASDETFGSIFQIAPEGAVEVGGKTYALDKVENNGLRVSSDPEANVVEVHYATDERGPEGEPDGVPDKYQIDVVFASVNGAFDGATQVEKLVTLTDSDGNWSEEGRYVLTGEDVPAATAADGYDQNSEKWDAEPVGAEVTKDGKRFFVVSFGEGVYLAKVQFYFDGELDDSLTEASDETFGSIFQIAPEGAVEVGGKTYALDKVENNGLRVSSDPEANVVEVHYATDERGPEGEPDGVPDKYQGIVNYFVENGAWEDGTAESKSEVVNFFEKNEDGEWVEVENPSLSEVPENMVPDAGYDKYEGHWTPVPTIEGLEPGGNKSFTYNFDINSYVIEVQVVNGTTNAGSEEAPLVVENNGDRGYTFTANEGYVLDTVTVDGQPASLENGTYTFTNVTSDGHSIVVRYAADANNDGIPDQYQAVVNYNVANGTWANGTTATVTEYVNLFELRNNEWVAIQPVINVPAGMIANAGYANGSWNAIPQVSDLAAGQTVNYTYSFTAAQTVVPTPDPVTPPAPPAGGGTAAPLPTVVPTLTPAAVTPAAPAAPAAPAPAAPAGETIDDDATPQAAAPAAQDEAPAAQQIEDDGTPMGAFDEPHCWVHWVMLIGILLTAAYGLVVVRRRLHMADDVDDYEKKVLGIEDEAEPAYVPLSGSQTL